MPLQYGHKKRATGPSKWAAVVVLLGLCLWASMVFGCMAGRIAALYGFDSRLGTVHKIAGQAIYNPLVLLSWPDSFWTETETDDLLKQGLLALVLPPLLIVGLIMLGKNSQAAKDLHGSAHWADRKEIEEMGYLAGQGVYVGGWWDERKKMQFYLRHDGPEHILCFAPTRSGKGVGLILPTLLSWPDSSVVLDIKGENYALTSGFLKSQGHTIFRFDPSDSERLSSRFNPLEEIRLDTARGIADVQQVSSMVLDPDGRGLEDYWNKAAFGFFGGVMLHCLIMVQYRENRRASLYDVSLMLEDPKREGGPSELFKEIIETDHAACLQEMWPHISQELAEAMHIFCASAASGMLAKADKEMAGVVSTATSNLALYRDPVVSFNVGASDFHIKDLMNQDTPCNLYLVVSPADIDRLRPLLRIFAAQLLGRLTEKMEFSGGGTKAGYKYRLLLMLDEFTSLGKLAIVERAIAYMAGYGVKGYFIVQDTKQLNAVYGQDNALMANCHVRIAYAPNLPETAEYLSKLTGTTTVVQTKKSISSGKGGRSVSRSIQETARALLTPDECLRLPGIRKLNGCIEPGDMLIFTAGNSPIYGRQILHFLDPVFLRRSSTPPSTADSLYCQRETKKVETREVPPIESAAAAYKRFLGDLPEEVTAT